MNFSLALITPPAAPVVTLEDAKQHLRVDFDDDDGVIETCFAAATAIIDPAAGGNLGRALREQVWELRLCSFPAGSIELPYPPLLAVHSLRYDDGDGVEVELSDGEYRIQGPNERGKFELAPVYNTSWPTARDDNGSVRIQFSAGYPEPDEDDETMPFGIIAWIKLVAGTLYEHRESMIAGVPVAPLPTHILQLISPYRVY